jgi:hypothetical protein
MHLLSVRIARSKLPRTGQLLFIVGVLQFFVWGCSSMVRSTTDKELLNVLIKNPQAVVGDYFEVQANNDGKPDDEFIAFSDPDSKASLEDLASKDKKASESNLTYYKKQGIFVNLNEGLNKEQNKAKLLFQVIDFTKARNKEYPYLKIQPCNKKYIGTTWWIDSLDFAKRAKLTMSPYGRK